MKLKRLLAFVLSAAVAVGAFADQPFRNHRYDSFKATPTEPGQTVFVGNSITNMHSWFEAFGSHQEVIGRGNSGGFTTEVLDNLESFIDSKPAKLFLMIGTNDISSGVDPILNARRVMAIVKRVRLESPETQIYVETILPRKNNAKHDYEQNNDSLRKWIPALNDPRVQLVDLSEALAGMGESMNNAWSNDGLHPRPKGYAAWCHQIEDLVGYQTVYPEAADLTKQNGCGATSANAARIEQFPYFPIDEGDVLFFGDEQVHGGEWHELLRSDKIKDRAQTWGWGGINLTIAKNVVKSAIEGQAHKPAKIFLFYGIADKNETNYRALVDEAKAQAPDAKIYLVSLTPSANAQENNTRTSFNTIMKTVAEEKGATYVDVYTPVNAELSKNIMNTNYVSGHGYIVMANELAKHLEEENVNPVSEEEYQAVYTSRTNRTIIGKVLTSAVMALDEADETDAARLNEAIANAVAAINKEGLTAEEAETVVAPIKTILSEMYAPKASTDSEIHWYALKSDRGNRYVSVSSGALTGVTAAPADPTPGNDIWKFVAREDNTFDIISGSGLYISPAAGHNSQLKTSATAPGAGWTFRAADAGPGKFVITSGTNAEFNQTPAALNFAIYNWYGETFPNLSDQGCTYSFIEYTGTIGEPEPVEIPEPILTLVDHEFDGSAPYRVPDALAAPVLASETSTIAIDMSAAPSASIRALIAATNTEDDNAYFTYSTTNTGAAGLRYIGKQGAEGQYTRAYSGTEHVKFVVICDPVNGYRYYHNGDEVFNCTVAATGAYGIKSPGNVDDADALYLGGLVTASESNKYPFDGTLHSVRFYDRALSAEQVASLTWEGLTETKPEVPVTAIAINPETLQLIAGDTYTVNVTKEPANTTDANPVVFSSSNEAVATVDANGLVTAVSAGTANITATLGELTAVCAVTVTDKEDSITEISLDAAGRSVYDLQGRRVINPVRGLYIVNGRKAFLK